MSDTIDRPPTTDIVELVEDDDIVTTAYDILYGLELEDGRLWGEAAIEWQLNDAQHILLPGYKQANFLTRPRGGSKSTDIAGYGLGWLVAEAPPRMHSYVVATAEEQSKEVLDAAEGFIARTPGLSDYVMCESNTIFAANGAQFHVLTSDGSSAWGKGRDTAFIILDEFAQWPETKKYRKLWVAMLTATQKTPGLRLIILTSAGEPGHFSYDVIDEAENGTTSEFWYVSQMPGPVPWATQASLEMQRPHLTDSEFQRLHLNKWTAEEDRLITEEEWDAAAVLKGSLPAVKGVKYAITVDIGVKVDPTVIVVSHAEPMAGDLEHKRVVIDHLDRFIPKVAKKKSGADAQEVVLNEVEMRIKLLHAEYNRAPVWGDPSQFIQMRQNLARSGIRVKEFKFTPTSVGELGSGLVLALENLQVWLPKIAALKDELMHVRLKQTTPGSYRLDHDEKRHDDQAVTIGMAVSVWLGKAVSTTQAFKDMMRRRRAERLEDGETNPETGDVNARRAAREVRRHERRVRERPERGRRNRAAAEARCAHRWRVRDDGVTCCVYCPTVKD